VLGRTGTQHGVGLMLMGRYRAVVPGPAKSWTPTIARRQIRADKATETYEAKVGQHCWLAVRSVGGTQVLGPVAVSITLVWPRPKHATGAHKGRPVGRYPHAVAPDVDKVARSILDGMQLRTVLGKRLQGGGVIEDDARVYDLRVVSWYAAEGEEAHAVIEWG